MNTVRHPRRTGSGRTLRRRAGMGSRVVLAVAMLALTLGVAQAEQVARPTAAAAAPGSPGSPSSPSTVFEEGFEQGTGAATVPLSAYAPAGGGSYSADAYWLNTAVCNGVILRYEDPTWGAGHCTPTDATASRNQLRRLSDILGQVDAGVAGGATAGSATMGSTAATRANHALGELTVGTAGGANLVTFGSGDLDLTSSGSRYYNVSLDVAETSCGAAGGANNSRLDVQLVTGGSTLPVNSAPIRACTDPRTGFYAAPAIAGDTAAPAIRAGRLFTDGSVLLTSAQVADLSVVVRNREGAATGNDAAIDNIRLVDATPQLDKAFSPTDLVSGQVSTLTFTVTNRQDLGEKLDWSFTDQLPAGVTVAATPNRGGTCAQRGGAAFTVTAPAGATSIGVVGGDLASGSASCTITLDVTSTTAGSHTNGPANITATGLDLPGSSTLDVRMPDPFACVEPTVFIGNRDNTVLDQQIQDDVGGSSFENIVSAQGWTYNALGYNPVDGLLYATSVIPRGAASKPAGHLLIIGADGVVYDQGLITGVPSPSNRGLNAGTFDDSGNYFVTPSSAASNNGNGLVYQLDLATRVATPIPNQTLPLDINDYTWADGFLWGAINQEATFVRVDPATGQVSTFPAPDVLNRGTPGTSRGAYGAAWTYGNGNLGFNENSGNLIQVRVTDPASANPTFTLVSSADGPAAVNMDGAACTVPTDLRLEKLGSTTVDPTGAVVLPGGFVDFVLRVSNVGPTNSSGSVLTDDLPIGYTNVTTTAPGCTVSGSAAAGFQLSCVLGPLGAGEHRDIPLRARFPQSGCLTNTGSVLGNEEETDPNNNTGSLQTCVGANALALVKTAGTPVDVNGDGLTNAGDRISFTFELTNTGQLPLTNLTVTDPKIGAVSCPVTSLAVGASTTCVGVNPYTITAADVGVGSVDNTATANGRDPNNVDVPSNPSSTTTPIQIADPELAMEKTAGTPVDVNDDGLTGVGDTIQYSFEVTNTGNVALTSIAVSDPLAGPVTCAATSLAVGASTTCLADDVYVITAADVIAGQVHNVATATGRDPGGNPVDPAEDETTTPTETADPQLLLDKRAGTPVDVNGSGITDAGDTIQFSFTVTNTGNVPVTDLAVDDPLAGDVTCAATSLAVDASTTCVADEVYVITAADEAAGRVDNVAVATGTDPDGGPVESNEDDTTTPTDVPAPALTIDKVAGTPVDVNQSGLVDAGDTIEFSFTVTNSGDVPLTDIAVSDPLAGPVTCEDTDLAVGASTNCVADDPYVITAADVAAGSVRNVAIATGEDPDGEPVESPEDETETPTETPEPELGLVKTAATPVDVNGSGLVDAGDTIQFTFEVTNTGNVPISDIVVDDPLAGPVTCAATALLPGASTTCTADDLYVITAADVAAGSVDNVAIATGTDPDDEPVESPEDETSTPTETPDPQLLLEKRAGTPMDVNSSGLTDAGDTIQFTFEVTNTGNVPVTDLAIDDPLVGDVTCAATSLAVDASTTCVADELYVITEADEIAGQVDNVAVANGTDPDGEPVESNEDDTTTPVETPDPQLLLDKRAGIPVDVNGNGLTDAGDTIQFTFEVTNTGNVPVTDLAVDDPLAGDVTCAATSLAVDASTTCVADEVYVITAADEAAGRVDNVAVATGTDPDGEPVESNEDDTTTPTDVPTGEPGLTIDKVAGTPVDVNGSGLTDAGDTIEFSFTVTNTGEVPLTDIEVDDPLAGPVTCDETDLAVGASTRCVADDLYVITAADVAAGAVRNVAIATGEDPDGEPVESPEDETETPTETPDPELDLEKTAGNPTDVNANGLVDAGDTIEFTFEVTNTGNVPVTSIAIDDPLVGNVTCAATALAPGSSTTCTADELYVITAADEDAGRVHNVAIATGEDPDGEPVESPEDDTTTPVDEADPQLALEKRAGTPVDVNGSGLTDAGDTILYSFTVTNTGNVPVTDVAIDDPLVGAVTCADTSLAVDASTTCTADDVYVITEADEIAGRVDNVAVANGTDPDGEPVESNEDDTTTPVETPDPQLLLDKRAGIPVDVNGNGLTDAGDTIQFTFEVTNTGNVPVTDLAIDDPLAGDVTCAATSLAVDASTTCVADDLYVITAADEAAGRVDNVAVATGTDPDGGPVESNEDDTTTPTDTPVGDPGLTIDKVAGTPVDVNQSGLVDAGDTIEFSFTVTNSGDVPLTDIEVDDPLAGPVTCEETDLAVGASTSCVADDPYVITADDVEAGVVRNVATATGTDPDGEPVESPEDETTTPTETPDPELDLVKTAGTPTDVNGSGLVDAGDTIEFSFEVTNTGNVPVTSIAIDDPLVGDVTCAATALLPGASTTCTADDLYVITDADAAAGSVDNVAIATGEDPDGEPVESPEDETSTPTETPDPELDLEKSAGTPVDVNESGLVDAGDTIEFTFEVTNTGNVPITEIAIDDPLVGAVTCEATALAPGASTSCTADDVYVITAADVIAGQVRNVAIATGEDPDGEPVESPEDETETPVETPDPQLLLDKRAGTPVDVNGSGITDAGDTIQFSFTVTNTGNVPVTDLAVDDPLAGDVTCAATSLAVDASTTCVADEVYVITAADEAAGRVDNVAVATATDPDGEPVESNEDDTTTPTDVPAPALTIDKVAGTPVDINGSGLTDAGDTIRFRFTVTNSGDVPLTDIAVSDPLAGPVTCEETDLAVGASTSCVADDPYVITADDVEAGVVRNVATATGTDPDGEPVESPEDETETPTETPDPELDLVKTAGTPTDVNGNGLVDAGDTIEFTFEVTNTGNVPVTSIAIDDPLVGDVTCAATALLPGASTTCTADDLYVITDADVARGSVRNVATATGEDPDGEPVDPPTDETETPTETPDPSLSLEKVAGTPVDVNDSGLVDAGDTIEFTFTVTNTGDVLVSGIVVDDPLAGPVTCAATSLLPGASTTCAADEAYVITAADVAAGRVHNVATASGEDPGGNPVESPEDETTTPTDTPDPQLLLDKRAGIAVDVNGNGLTDAGDTIRYSFTVTNTGNVPVTDLAIDDPLAGAVTCAATSLAVDASTTCVADEVYVITAADEAAGRVDNVAVATATDPDDEPVESNPDDTTTPTDVAAPALQLDKLAGTPVDVNGSGLVDAGDTVEFTFTVTNAGDVLVSDLAIDDPLVGDVTCAATSLIPGASTTCVADEVYVITAADVAAGQVRNVATATGTDPDGEPVESPEDETETPTETPDPELDLVKTAGTPTDVNGNGLVDAGDTIEFSFEVTNTGNVPITEIAIDDPLVGDVTCEATTLAAGASTSCVADDLYVITAADVARGSVRNVATATGEDPDGEPVDPPTDETETPVDVPDPRVSIDKSLDGPATANGDGTWTVGYRITVANTGDVPTAYDLTDALRFGSGSSVLGAAVTNERPGSITVNDGWDGITDTLVVEDEPIAVDATHVYEVSVRVSVAASVSSSSADCRRTTTEQGTGFLNTATIEFGSTTVDDEACAPIPAISIDKEVAEEPVIAEDGSFTIAYDLTVTNAGGAPGRYDLTDDLQWGDGLVVDRAEVTAPRGLSARASWNGTSDTLIASDVGIGEGATHVWRVTVSGHVTTDLSESSGSCDEGPTGSGRGLLNTASIDVNGRTATDDACVPVIPDADELPEQEDNLPTDPGSGPGTGSGPSSGGRTGPLARTGLAIGGLVLTGLALVLGGAVVLSGQRRFARRR